MNPLLEIRGLSKSFGALTVLSDINLTLDRGQTKVVIGPSGTGKSTLLRCINRLMAPDQGTVFLDGMPITTSNVDKARSQIGYVFQDFNLFLHLRALDNVRLGLRKVKHMGYQEATERAMSELERVGLSDKANSYPAELSGGQQQRVSIARALAMDPKIILFDEPTSALDPQLTDEVLSVMSDLANNGITMLVVTHEMSFARSAADEVVVMAGGKIVRSAPPEEVFNRRNKLRTVRTG